MEDFDRSIFDLDELTDSLVDALVNKPDQPVQKGKVFVDFDTTLFAFDENQLKHTAEALRKLQEAGIRVIVWTSLDAECVRHVKSWLDTKGIPYDEVQAGKPDYSCLIDARSLTFDGNWDYVVGRAIRFHTAANVDAVGPTTFEEALDQALRRQRDVMIERQKKYGPDNMRSAGVLGAVNRAYQDKMARIKNFHERIDLRNKCLRAGMPLEIVDKYLPIQNVSDESIEDSHIDAANYIGPICLMLLWNTWGLPLACAGEVDTEDNEKTEVATANARS